MTERKRVFFDCNVFDYFYYRQRNPFQEITNDKYKIVMMPEIRKEVFSANTSEPIKLWAEQLLKANDVQDHPRFGFTELGKSIPEGITGLTTFNIKKALCCP